MLWRKMVHVCISREFRVLAVRQSSPITNWLRALCRSLHAELGGKGVGAIGMCLTGNFALALMVDSAVMAPVLSQPSLPFPFGKARRERPTYFGRRPGHRQGPRRSGSWPSFHRGQSVSARAV